MTKPIQLDKHYNCKVVTDDNKTYLVDALRLHNNNLHHWDGWICNAGMDSIRIDSDLNVYNAGCKQKLIANLKHLSESNTSLQLPTTPTICDKPTCDGCSYDLQLTKFDPDHCVNCD